MASNGFVVKPAPAQPDPKEYEHLTQKERMLAGYPYKPSDPVLCAERLRARQLVRKFNDSAVEDKEGRKAILKELLNPNSGNVFIEPPFRCDYGSYITIGEGSEVNFGLVILDVCEVVIGKRCLIAPNVHFYAATHPVCPIERRDFELGAPIKVGDDVWIGGQVVICPGVTIGDGVTIGAGSIVTKDVPSNVVVAGNPAKIIRYLPGYVPSSSEKSLK